MPTLLQIVRLEKACEQSIILAPLSMAATGTLVAEDLGKETRDATYAAVDLQRMAEAGVPRRQLEAALITLLREAEEIRAALAKAA